MYPTTLRQMFAPPSEPTETQKEMRAKVRAAFWETAQLLNNTLYNNADKNRCLDSLRDALMFAECTIDRGRSVVDLDALHRLFSYRESQDQVVVRLWLNAIDYADVRKMCSEHFVCEGKAEWLRKGRQGVLFGHTEVWVKRKIPVGWAVVVPDGAGTDDTAPDWEPKADDLIMIV